MLQASKGSHLLRRALRWLTRPWHVAIDLPAPDPNTIVWPRRVGA
jgi:hypothetical protein